MPELDRATVVDRFGHHGAKWDATASRLGPEAISMDVAEPDVVSPAPVVQALTEAAAHGCYGYTDVPDDFGQLVAGWCQRRHDWTIDPASVLFVPRFIQAVAVICRDILTPGSRVLEIGPAYAPIDEVLRATGHEIVHVPLRLDGDRAELDRDAFATAVASGVEAFVLCSPHNPTGRAWEADELEFMLRSCAENDVLVLSDEVHADFSDAHVPSGRVGSGARIVTGVSPAKSFGLAGIEAAAIIVPDEALRAQLTSGFRRSGMHNPNYFAVEGIMAAWGGECDGWLDELRDLVRDNQRMVASRLGSLDGVRVLETDATYLIFVDARGAQQRIGRPVLEAIAERGVAVSDGAGFGPGLDGWFRLVIAMPTPLLSTALDRIEAALGC